MSARAVTLLVNLLSVVAALYVTWALWEGDTFVSVFTAVAAYFVALEGAWFLAGFCGLCKPLRR